MRTELVDPRRPERFQAVLHAQREVCQGIAPCGQHQPVVVPHVGQELVEHGCLCRIPRRVEMPGDDDAPQVSGELCDDDPGGLGEVDDFVVDEHGRRLAVIIDAVAVATLHAERDAVAARLRNRGHRGRQSGPRNNSRRCFRLGVEPTCEGVVPDDAATQLPTVQIQIDEVHFRRQESGVHDLELGGRCLLATNIPRVHLDLLRSWGAQGQAELVGAPTRAAHADLASLVDEVDGVMCHVRDGRLCGLPRDGAADHLRIQILVDEAQAGHADVGREGIATLRDRASRPVAVHRVERVERMVDGAQALVALPGGDTAIGDEAVEARAEGRGVQRDQAFIGRADVRRAVRGKVAALLLRARVVEAPVDRLASGRELVPRLQEVPDATDRLSAQRRGLATLRFQAEGAPAKLGPRVLLLQKEAARADVRSARPGGHATLVLQAHAPLAVRRQVKDPHDLPVRAERS
mmetsp:Transcript_71271/g.206681  ORF Transcript_71271/g.206681 Transcript_71271/m.206681 type:complete len:463 (+) Transcript_71271:510-1898(+)